MTLLIAVEENLGDPDRLKDVISHFATGCKNLTHKHFSNNLLKGLCTVLAAAVIFSLAMAGAACIASLTGVVGWSLLIGSIVGVSAAAVGAISVYSLFPKTHAQKVMDTEMERMIQNAEVFLQF